MKCEMWLESGLATAVAFGAIALAVDMGCGEGLRPPTPDLAYARGYAGCLADVMLAKEAMRLSDAGIDRVALHARYDACTHNVEEVFGFDAGAPKGGQ